MSKLVLNGDTSGSVTLDAPAVSGTTTLTLPTTTGTLVVTSGAQTIEFADGSASAPSITNSGDTNTGIFFPAADTIAFAEGGTEVMRIDSAGNVGIGTTSPGVRTLAVVSATDKSTVGLFSGASYGVRIGTIAAVGGVIEGVDTTGISSYQPLVVGGSQVQFTTSGTERMRIDSSGYASGTVNGLGRGIYQSQQYYRLNSTVAGANATGAQSIFGVGVTLVGSTQYEFEAVFVLSKTAGTTSHSIGIGFGGTATLNNIGYNVTDSFSTNQIQTSASYQGGTILAATNTTITGATTSATVYFSVILKGTVSVNAGGTFIPQYTLSAAPGGAYTTQIGSYIKIAPLAASGANVSIGSWA